jgi:hypothetical protein
MRKTLNRLYLIGLMGVVMSIYSCSKDETITPLQQSIGIYDYYGPNSVYSIDQNGNVSSGEGKIVIRGVSDNRVSFTVYIKNSIDEKVWIIPKCEIMPLDTTGDLGAPFGRIIDVRDNSEVGTLNNWPYIKGGLRRITIVANSFIVGNQGTLHLKGTARKQAD